MPRQIKSVKLCEWCDMPFHVKSGHYGAKFCSISHSMLYQWNIAGRTPRALNQPASEPLSISHD